MFSFRPFLTAILLLSLYKSYAGYHVRRIHATGPTLLNGAFSAAFLVSGRGFLVLLLVKWWF